MNQTDFDDVLNALCDGLPPDEAQGLRDERAAILEYCGGFSRQEAERRAGLIVKPQAKSA